MQYVTWYGFLSFTKTWVKIEAVNMVKNFLIGQKKWTTDATKTAWKRAIQKRAEAAGDLISNKTADKTTSISKKSSAHSTKLHSKIDDANGEIEVQKKR